MTSLAAFALLVAVHTESAAALAEKSGNLKQLVNWLLRRGLIALTTGDFPQAGAAIDRALELALREASPTNLASVYTLQLPTRYWRGDLAGTEEHFTAGLNASDVRIFRIKAAPQSTPLGAHSMQRWLTPESSRPLGVSLFLYE